MLYLFVLLRGGLCTWHRTLLTLLDSCVSSLRRGHANLLCIVPILTDDPRRESCVDLLSCFCVLVCLSFLCSVDLSSQLFPFFASVISIPRLLSAGLTHLPAHLRAQHAHASIRKQMRGCKHAQAPWLGSNRRIRGLPKAIRPPTADPEPTLCRAPPPRVCESGTPAFPPVWFK